MSDQVLIHKNLLIVDDEADLREIISSEMEYLGANVFQAENVMVAKKVLQEHPIQLIISDIRMPGGTGIDLLDFVKSKNATLPAVILITGFSDISLEDALDKGAEGLMNKPFKLDDLIKVVQRSLSSLDQRFSPLSQNDFLELEVEGVCFGRGGMSFISKAGFTKIMPGEVVPFSLSSQGQQYKGEGICRWAHPVEVGSNRQAVGLEFTKLSSQTLAQLKELMLQKNEISFIPSTKKLIS